MARKPCSRHGCGRLVPKGTTHCTDHEREADRARGSRQQRGYNAAHEAERARWLPVVETGEVDCARCHQHIEPGTPWDLGHADDRASWTGPEHARCNRQAGGRAAHDHTA